MMNNKPAFAITLLIGLGIGLCSGVSAVITNNKYKDHLYPHNAACTKRVCILEEGDWVVDRRDATDVRLVLESRSDDAVKVAGYNNWLYRVIWRHTTPPVENK